MFYFPSGVYPGKDGSSCYLNKIISVQFSIYISGINVQSNKSNHNINLSQGPSEGRRSYQSIFIVEYSLGVITIFFSPYSCQSGDQTPVLSNLQSKISSITP